MKRRGIARVGDLGIHNANCQFYIEMSASKESGRIIDVFGVI
jgi:hypothetical protein